MSYPANNHFFSHARTALKYGLKQLDLKTGDYILVPEYICDVVLHPLGQLGLLHRYYSTDKYFSPKWNKLKNLIDDKTKAILMVHYFGQPQDIPKFQSFCNKHKLLLIEDNAHGYGGLFNGQLLGTYGDIGISSPRKTLSILSGGLLWINNNILDFVPHCPDHPVLLRDHIKRIFNLNSSLKIRLKKKIINRPIYEDLNEFRESVKSDYSIDKWSKRIIDKTDWEYTAKSRREHYHHWKDFAYHNKLTPVFTELYSQANPWCFPAYVQNHSEAIEWFNWGWKNNVHVFSWPTLPYEIVKNNGESLNRWKKLICFGI